MNNPMPNTLAEAPQVRDSYRRGAVLGFTIAELIILIIFSLLLLLANSIREKDVELAQKEKEIQEIRAENRAVEDIRERLVEVVRLGSRKKVYDDYFRELILARDQAPSLHSEISELQEKVDSLENIEATLEKITGESAVSEALDRMAPMLEQMQDIAKRAELDKAENNFISRIENVIEAAKVISESEEVEGATIADRARYLVERDQEQSNDIKHLRGRVSALSNKLLVGGKGTDHPSCWYVEGTTKPEYIFDIALTNTGLIIRRRNLPHLKRELEPLVNNVAFERDLSPNFFRKATRPLFEWSVYEECRFFVRAFDLTGPAEKAIYKSHLRTLESHFYKYIVTDERFTVEMVREKTRDG